jgi:hypothetical protein
MKAEELFEKDKWGAFFEFVSVEQAKKEEIIPVTHARYFPDKCEEVNDHGIKQGCDSDMIISRSLTRLMCCNPRCQVKLAYALDEMLDRFSCKHVGEQTCKNIVRYAFKFMELKSHVEILTMEDKHLVPDVRGMNFVWFRQAIAKATETSLTFPDMVSRLAIPEFKTSAIKIFAGISSTKELVEKIKTAGGIQKFMLSKGIEDQMKVFYLSEFLQDIAFAEFRAFKKIRSVGKMKMQVCITGNLSPEGYKITKAEFIELCNKLGTVGNYRMFDVEMTTAIQTTAYVIADYRSNTDKYSIAKSREEVEGKKILYTSSEFLRYLKGVVECVTEKKPIESLT